MWSGSGSPCSKRGGRPLCRARQVGQRLLRGGLLYGMPLTACTGTASSFPGCPLSAGVQLVEPLAVAPGERVVVKRRFSAFFATHLDSVLK